MSDADVWSDISSKLSFSKNGNQMRLMVETLQYEQPALSMVLDPTDII